MNGRLNPFAKVVMYGVILLIVAIYLLPLFYLFNLSLKTPAEYLSNPISITKALHTKNFSDAWKIGGFGNYIMNSVIYVTVPTIISLIITLLCAFPLSREYVRKSNMWYLFFLMSLFLPSGLIPTFLLALKLHLYNNMPGYILMKIGGVGLGLFILIGFIKSVPRELDEAASIDGCGYFRFVLTIIPHLVKPALVTNALFGSIGIWNDIISPTIYLSNPKLHPVVLGLYKFYGVYSNQWTVLAAGMVIVATPLILLFIGLQRYFIEGAWSGAVKM